MSNNTNKTTHSVDATSAVIENLDLVLDHLKTIEQSMQDLLSSYATKEAGTSIQIKSTHSAFEQLIQFIINQRKKTAP